MRSACRRSRHQSREGLISHPAAVTIASAGETRYLALAYEAPILGAQQRLKIVVAHMTAADEPAMADLTALAR